MSKSHDNPVNQIEDSMKKWKRRIYRVRNCGIIWFLASLLLFIIGVILLVYFAKYISTEETSKKAGGITGVVLLLLGILGIFIAIIMIIMFVHLFRKMQKRVVGGMPPNTKYSAVNLPVGSYPKQKMEEISPAAYPGAEPTAPEPSEPPSTNLEDIKVTENARF